MPQSKVPCDTSTGACNQTTVAALAAGRVLAGRAGVALIATSTSAGTATAGTATTAATA